MKFVRDRWRECTNCAVFFNMSLMVSMICLLRTVSNKAFCGICHQATVIFLQLHCIFYVYQVLPILVVGFLKAKLLCFRRVLSCTRNKDCNAHCQTKCKDIYSNTLIHKTRFNDMKIDYTRESIDPEGRLIKQGVHCVLSA